MKYNVISRGDELSDQLMQRFHLLAQAKGMAVDEAEPDIVVSIGGDGTMLHAFHSYIHRLQMNSFVGVHTGHLGFYADWKADEIELLIELMSIPNSMDLKQRWVEYPIVEGEITTDQGVHTFKALNEFTLKGDEATLVAQLRVNKQPLEMFRGDGICISSPSGSTAYNKSLGGALIHPSLETIQIAEIASINNRVFRTLGSSMILPKHHHCEIVPKASQRIQLSVDHLIYEYESIRSLRFKVADDKIRFARYRPFPFWNRVREAFIGEELS